MQAHTSGAFQYASEPQAAPGKGRRTKYRPEEDQAAQQQLAGTHLMYDRRVVRGSTYAAKVMTTTMQRDVERLRDDQDRAARKDLLRQRRLAGSTRASTPPPMEGRMHMVMQTDDFLEELTDRPIETDAATQTHPLMDRPPSPLFVPAKIGVDVDTQIEAGDLFDFDYEVEPLLEVLVGKTLHTSMLEVMQEEEIEAIRRRQHDLQQVRDAELAEVQRLESEARRRHAEKERRATQERERRKQRQEVDEKVAARTLAKSYLGSLHLSVFDSLRDAGLFYDPVRKELEDVYLPGLLDQVAAGTSRLTAARAMVDELIKASAARARMIKAQADREREERDKVRREEEEKERVRLDAEKAKKAEAAAAAAAAAAAEPAE